jgi:hypothetical protein
LDYIPVDPGLVVCCGAVDLDHATASNTNIAFGFVQLRKELASVSVVLAVLLKELHRDRSVSNCPQRPLLWFLVPLRPL